MSRYLKLLFVFSYMLLFFLIYQNFVEQDESNLHNLFGGSEKYERGGIVFTEYIDQEDKIDIIDKSIDLSKKEDISLKFFLTDRTEEGYTKSIDYYVTAGDEYIKSYLPKGTEVPDNFSQNDFYFTTKDTQDSKAIKIFTYKEDMDFSMYPMHMAKNNEDFIFEDLEYFYRQEQNNIRQKVGETFSQHQFYFGDIGSHQFEKDSAIRNLFIYYSFVCLILCLIYILFKISYRSKELMVYRLHGYSDFISMIKILRPEIILNIISFIGVPLIGSFIIFGGYNYRMNEFLIYNYAYLGLLFMVFIMSVIFGIIILNTRRMIDFLKNKTFNEIITSISFVLTIAICITILPRVEEPFRNLVSIYKIKSNMDESGHIYGQYNEIWLKLTKERDFEFDNTHDDPVYEKHKEIYNKLNKEKLLIKFRPNFYVDQGQIDNIQIGPGNFEEYLAYEINENYLSMLKLFDSGHELSLPDLKENTAFIIMDKSLYSNTRWHPSNFNLESGVNVNLILYDKVKYIDFAFIEAEDYQYGPIFFLEKDNNNLSIASIDTGLFVNDTDLDMVENILKDYNVLSSIGFRNNMEILERRYSNLSRSFFDQLISIVPAVILLFISLQTMKFFYIKTYIKEWSVYKSLGYQALYVVRKYIIELAVIVGLSLLYYILIVRWIPIYTLILLLLICLINGILVLKAYNNLNIRENLG